MLSHRWARSAALLAVACLALVQCAAAQESECAEFAFEEGESPRAVLTLGGQAIRVVVDTGCTVSVVDARFRNRLGPEGSGVNLSSDVATSEMTRYACEGGTVGKLALDLPSMICTDLGDMIAGEGVDGFLGMDFLARYCVDFDPDAGVMRISRQMPAEVTGDQTQLPLSYSRFRVPIVVGRASRDVELQLKIDTGFNGGLQLSPVDEKRVFPDGFGASVPGVAQTLHGEVSSRKTRVPQLELGEFRATDILCDIKNPAGVSTKAGFRFLSRYRAIFDFPCDILTLVRATKPYNNNADMSGLHIIRRGQRTVVDDVDDDSPATQAGLHAGDELLTIDGKPVPERPTAIRRRLASGDGNVVQLRVRDAAEAERVVDLTLRRRI